MYFPSLEIITEMNAKDKFDQNMHLGTNVNAIGI